MTATSISTPTVRRAADRAARRGLDRVGIPGWLQAMPFGLVFAFFFIIPLILVVIVSFWDYNDYEMLPSLHDAQLHRDLRRLPHSAA